MTFTLTTKEFAAARIFVQECLTAMGGKRPADLANDEFTWVYLDNLTDAGYSRFEAAGLMSALQAKNFIQEYDKKTWIVTTKGWQWMDTVWDV